MTCFTHIHEAQKFSKNGTIPNGADGVDAIAKINWRGSSII